LTAGGAFYELIIGMLGEVGLDGVPVPLVIADLFAAGADRRQKISRQTCPTDSCGEKPVNRSAAGFE